MSKLKFGLVGCQARPTPKKEDKEDMPGPSSGATETRERPEPPWARFKKKMVAKSSDNDESLSHDTREVGQPESGETSRATRQYYGITDPVMHLA